MESPLFVGSFSFFIGWLAREWSQPKIDKPTPNCHCDCNCLTGQGQEGNYTSGQFWILVLVGLVLVVVFSNTALALRFTYKDDSTGTDKVLSVDVVKGKSKGIYGATKGLSIASY